MGYYIKPCKCEENGRESGFEANDNIFNAIKKFDTSISTNKKLLMYQWTVFL